MKHNRLFSVYVLLFLLFAMILPVACSRQSQQKNNNTSTENTTEEKAAEKEKQSVPVVKDRKNEGQGGQDTNLKITETKLPDIKTSYTIGTQKYLNLLPYYPDSAIRPMDFHIGNLFEEDGSTDEAISAKDAVAVFLDSVIAGHIDTALIADGEDSELFRLISYHAADAGIITGYRIGTAHVREDETARVIVRIYGKSEGVNSEVYLAMSGEKWLVTDIQTDFYKLESGGSTSGDKFLPETYQSVYDDF